MCESCVCVRVCECVAMTARLYQTSQAIRQDNHCYTPAAPQSQCFGLHPCGCAPTLWTLRGGPSTGRGGMSYDPLHLTAHPGRRRNAGLRKGRGFPSAPPGPRPRQGPRGAGRSDSRAQSPCHPAGWTSGLSKAMLDCSATPAEPPCHPSGWTRGLSRPCTITNTVLWFSRRVRNRQ